MIELPAAMAVTTPVVELTVAAAGLLLLQVPPLLPLLVNVADKPAHTEDAPLTEPAFATALTFTVAEVEDVAHAEVTVYVMVAVPVPVPKTTPFTSTIAIAALLVLHIPPAVPLVLKLIVELAHTLEGPLIVPALAAGLTVTLYVANDDPQVLATK